MSDENENIEMTVKDPISQYISKQTSRLLKWMDKARTKKAHWPSLQQIVFKKNRIQATDGMRIHVIQLQPEINMLQGKFDLKNQISSGDTLLSLEKIDRGVMPVEIEEVIPTGDPDAEFWIDPQMLKDTLTGMAHGPVKIKYWKKNNALELYGKVSKQKVYALVMLMDVAELKGELWDPFEDQRDPPAEQE